jgi:hypothetical protein
VAIFIGRVIIASAGYNRKKIILLLDIFIADKKTKIHDLKNGTNVR